MTFAQKPTESQKQKIIEVHLKPQTEFKTKVDLFCLSIDLSSYSHIDKDSISIHDPTNPFKILGYVVDKTFWVNNKLQTANWSSYKGEQNTYYFQDSTLIKVASITNDGKLIEYYYSEEDNKTSPSLLYRLKELIPELSDFYTKLFVGRSYLKK